MDSIHVMQVSGQVPATTRQVYYTGTDALYEGYAVCYDVTASEANRSVHVAKPTFNNSGEFAGVVAPGQTIAARTSGGTWVNIISVEGAIARGVNVYTDESLTNGDLLGVIPGSFALGRCVFGQPVARVLATTDRSSTAGVVNTQFGWIASTLSDSDIESKIVRHFDHFTKGGMLVAVANLHDYELVGTGSTFTSADALAIGASDAAVDATKAGPGVGLVTTAAASWLANVATPGEPFSVSANKNLFFRARIAVAATATTQLFVGLGTAAVTDAIDTGDTDGIGFRLLATVLSFVYAKAATPSVIETLTGWTSAAIASPAVAADVFVDLAFLVRNRNGTKEVSIWVNGTQISHTTVTANVCDNQSLTLRLAAGNSAATTATTLKIDRLEINNYFG